MDARMKRAQHEMKNPELLRIEVEQIWIALDTEGSVMRRVRVIAPYTFKTDEKIWVYEEMSGGKLRTQIGRLGRVPEFNLRMVFRPEQ